MFDLFVYCCAVCESASCRDPYRHEGEPLQEDCCLCQGKKALKLFALCNSTKVMRNVRLLSEFNLWFDLSAENKLAYFFYIFEESHADI